MSTYSELDQQLIHLIRDGLPAYLDAVAAYCRPLEEAAGGPTEETLAIRASAAASVAAADTAWEEITGRPLTRTRALAQGLI